MPYIYILRCEDQSLYTGIAKDVRRRIREHYYRKKTGAKYTKSHPVQALEMVWETDSWSDAGKLEYRIKRLKKERKEELLLHPERADQMADGTYRPYPEMTLSMCLAKEEVADGQA